MKDPSPVHSLNALTDREREIITLISAGLSNKDIAEELVLSYYTVTWYIKQIFTKLGVKRRTQAVAVARSLGILEGDTAALPKDIYKHNLPVQLTSFVGRDNETAKIFELLDNEDCRLLSLVGPGGIGKTRLALWVAARRSDQFTDGVYFVALQPLTSHEKILPTIVNSLGKKLRSDSQNPRRPLFDFLQEKSILLLMDNFEHVLEGVQIVPDLLAAAAGVKIIVTSRESLNLREEYIFNVLGLPFPKDGLARDNKPFHAVELFAERASRVCPNFSLEDAYTEVVEICRLVEGMPLAIELAASWLKTLSCHQITAEIRQGLDGLVTTMRNVPERHQSIWATFDASWKSLNDAEKMVFRQLSIFRGGCTREAACHVAGANRWILQALTDKSFIRWDVVNRRYDIHELLRQYGKSQLEQSSTDIPGVHERHCAYYAELLARNRDNIFSNRQLQMMQELEPDVENISMAWQTATDQVRVQDILKSVHTLAYFYIFRGRFLEEASAFEDAVHSLESEAPDYRNIMALAVLLSYLGWIYIRIGEYELAETRFLRSQLLYQRVGEPPPAGIGTEPLTGLAMLACILGKYDEAERLGEKTRKVSQERNDWLNQQLGEYAIISANFQQGRYQAARELAEIWLMENRKTGGKWNLADPLNAMGNISRVMGEYDLAKNYYQESYEIRQIFNDPQGMAAARNFLGMTAALEGDTATANLYFQESYMLYKEIGDRGGVGSALCGLGTAAFTIGDYVVANRRFYKALEIARTIQYVPVIFAALIGIAELLIADGKGVQGVAILTLIHRHEQCGHEVGERANQILCRLSKEFRTESFQIARERGEGLSLDETVRKLLEEYENIKH